MQQFELIITELSAALLLGVLGVDLVMMLLHGRCTASGETA